MTLASSPADDDMVMLLPLMLQKYEFLSMLVLQFLSPRDTLISIMQVCKAWQSMALANIVSIQANLPSTPISADYLKYLANHAPKLSSISLAAITTEHVHVLMSHFGSRLKVRPDERRGRLAPALYYSLVMITAILMWQELELVCGDPRHLYYRMNQHEPILIPAVLRETINPLLSSMTSLRRLGLPSSLRPPQAASIITLPSHLVHLDLYQWCEITQVAIDSSYLQGSLTRLNLRGCLALEDISSIACLTSLLHLDASHCRRLRDLSPIASLTSLTSLNLSDCYQLMDVSFLSCLHNFLQHLNISGCCRVTNVTALSRLTKLQHLNLHQCGSISGMDSLASLPALLHLDLGRCFGGTTPVSSTLLSPPSFTSIQSMILRGGGPPEQQNYSMCVYVASLSCFWKTLKHLEFSHCDALTSLTCLSLEHLKSLQSLNLSYCTNLEHIAAIVHVRSTLMRLNITGCDRLLRRRLNRSVLSRRCWRLQRLSIDAAQSRSLWFIDYLLPNLPPSIHVFITAAGPNTTTTSSSSHHNVAATEYDRSICHSSQHQ